MAGLLAAALHVGGLGLYAAHLEHDSLLLSLDGRLGTFAKRVSSNELAVVELMEAPPGPPLFALPGPADESGFAGHPLPAADVELPGREAARRGGGERAGRTRFTGRRDESDLRSQIWNDPERYLLPRERNDRRGRASPESLARAPERGFDGRTERRRRARDGVERPTRGEAGDGRGHRGERAVEVELRDWQDADPLFDQPAGRRPARRRGATQPGKRSALQARGERAAEARRRGRLAEDRRAASASDETDPMPFELTRPSAAGRDGSGVKGHASSGVTADSRRRRAGSAASRAHTERGAGAALRARRQVPYFRNMYERVDARVEYPRDLALSLEQGELVVAFTLREGGEIEDIEVVKSSGFEEFDRAVRRGFRRAAPFGPVPRALRGDSAELRVNAPYRFSNPLIR